MFLNLKVIEVVRKISLSYLSFPFSPAPTLSSLFYYFTFSDLFLSLSLPLSLLFSLNIFLLPLKHTSLFFVSIHPSLYVDLPCSSLSVCLYACLPIRLHLSLCIFIYPFCLLESFELFLSAGIFSR